MSISELLISNNFNIDANSETLNPILVNPGSNTTLWANNTFSPPHLFFGSNDLSLNSSAPNLSEVLTVGNSADSNQINMNNNKIVNLANGVDEQDAITLSQLQSSIPNSIISSYSSTNTVPFSSTITTLINYNTPLVSSLNFVPTTGIYFVPSDGVYMCIVNVQFIAEDSSFFRLFIQKNGVPQLGISTNFNVSGSTDVEVGFTKLVFALASQGLSVGAFVFSGTSIAGPYDFTVIKVA